jgi:branched-chain amino acid transport system permease protein
MPADQIIGSIINVFILASVYILVALGFSFLFNLLGILNLAHGAVYMVGGYIGHVFASLLGLGPWVGLVIAMVCMALFGILAERAFFRPFVGDFDRVVVACIALTVVFQTAVNILVGDQIQGIPPFWNRVFTVNTVSVGANRIVVFVIGVILLGLVLWFVRRSVWGLRMQAIAMDRDGAALQGIRIFRVSAVCCVVAFGLAAIAGVLMGSYLQLGPYMGDFILNKVLMLVILAGIGSISGIFYTGLILGALDAILPLFMQGSKSDAITIAIVVVLLWLRPQGFFGHEATT